MAHPIGEEKIRAWLALLEVESRLADGLAKRLDAGAGLALPRYDVLFQLAEQGGALRMSELADKVLLSRSGLSRLIDRMEADGLVERREHPVDGRGASAVITTAGRKVLRKAIPIARDYIIEHFASRLTRAEARALYTTLEKLLAEARPMRATEGDPETSKQVAGAKK